LKDGDRRVRTEAIRALGQYDDDASFAEVLRALESSDSWMSVSAAENLGRFQSRSDLVVPKLIAAMSEKRPTSLRITALTPLRTFSPKDAVDAAAALIRNPSVTARTSAAGALRQLGEAGQARLDALGADPATKDLVPAGRGGGGRGARPERPVRSDADYQSLVERLIVPDYKGAARPRTIWQTPRGEIEIELYPGDAPFGVETMFKLVESGDIVGTEFSRVVPDFVDQQQGIRNAPTLRDEVNLRGLTRGNLSWASAGLDTGRPGYTLGNTPQPHNEGDFTSLGRVVAGADAMDKIEIGDKILAAKISRK